MFSVIDISLKWLPETAADISRVFRARHRRVSFLVSVHLSRRAERVITRREIDAVGVSS